MAISTLNAFGGTQKEYARRDVVDVPAGTARPSRLLKKSPVSL